jgi:tRNA(Ile)-lysidine synthase
MSWIQNKTVLLRSCPPGERYLIGVSGGRDSVVLLHWLLTCGYCDLVVCHLNHQLRGRAAAADARFVEKLVANYNKRIAGQAHLSRRNATKVDRLPKRKDGKRVACPTTASPRIELEIGTVDVRALAAKRKMSIEAAAREARYRFFAQVAGRKRCRTIFLAHHADDLVETFLINLFRGAGTTGLAAMRAVSVRQIGRVRLKIARPLLGVWRTQIDEYVREHRLNFREDTSNKDLAALRNRVRRRVIPYLEKTIGRHIRQSIWRAAAIFAEEESWIDDRLTGAPAATLSVSELRSLPVALQRRQVLRWLRRQNIADVGFDVIERVRSLLDHASGVAKINLPRDRHVRRRAGKIFLE